MTNVAIRAEGLGKKYTIGRLAPRHDTLRDALTEGVRRLTRPRGGRDGGAGEDVFWALRDVSFAVGRGEVVGVLGSNGAGKSTLLKILSRITEPTAGEARIEGRVGSLLEVGTGFHSELTGRENIYLSGAILGMRRAEIARRFDEIVAFAEVERFVDTPVKRYSSGMYLRLAFSVAAHLEPEILLVDEVLAVGDAAFQKKCLGRMGDVAREGRTVLFVSHNLVAMESLCERALWLREGRLAEDGPAGRVISDYLKTSFSSATERRWTAMESAPGNDKVRLRGARVRPVQGSAEDAIDVRTPFVFELEYWNLQPGASLNLSLHLFNDQGVLVFNAGPLEEPHPLPAGLFRDVCRVPGDLLNDGRYKIELLVVQDQGKVLHRFADLLTFDVLDTPELRGSWYGRWPGVVRLPLPWSTEAIDEEASEASWRAAPREAVR